MFGIALQIFQNYDPELRRQKLHLAVYVAQL